MRSHRERNYDLGACLYQADQSREEYYHHKNVAEATVRFEQIGDGEKKNEARHEENEDIPILEDIFHSNRAALVCYPVNVVDVYQLYANRCYLACYRRSCIRTEGEGEAHCVFRQILGRSYGLLGKNGAVHILENEFVSDLGRGIVRKVVVACIQVKTERALIRFYTVNDCAQFGRELDLVGRFGHPKSSDREDGDLNEKNYDDTPNGYFFPVGLFPRIS